MKTGRARIVLVGTGRMGAIRGKILYGNPRVEFCGVVDVNEEAAGKLANTFNVSGIGKSISRGCTTAFPCLS